MTERSITEGQTQPVIFQIKQEGGAAIDLTSHKVRVDLIPAGEGERTTYQSDDASPKITKIAGTDGRVQVDLSEMTPDGSPYVVRFWVIYNTTNKLEPAPPDDSLRLRVYPAH